MPTVDPPRQQAPMEAILPNTGNTDGISAPGRVVVNQQPKSEPRPQPENELSLRGGGFNVGFTCCNGMCSCHKHCC